MAQSEDQSDIAQLWDQALDEYAQVSDLDIRAVLSTQRSVSSIMMDQQHQLTSFSGFRHNKKKLDKLRTVISSNADIILSVAGHVATAASTAFPPSSAILTAFTYVMNASRHVSEDYDMIESFFDIMQSFLQRLSLLEGRIPPQKKFQLFLLKVFSSLLSLSAIARAYCLKGRFMKWAKALVDGKDPKLVGAYESLNENLSRLESAILIQNLRTTIEVKEEAKDINQNVKALQAQGQQIQTKLDDNTAMTEQTLAVAERAVVVGMETNAGVKEMMILSRDGAAFNQEMLRRQERLSQAIIGLQSSKNNKSSSKVGQSGMSKSANLTRFKNGLKAGDQGTMNERMQDLERAYVSNTFSWVQDEPVYAAIVDESQRLLWVRGSSGMGKSTVAFKTYQDLRERFETDSTTTVVSYFFNEEHHNDSSVVDMMKWCAAKIAEKDVHYCESTLVKIKEVDMDEIDALSASDLLFTEPYSKTSSRRIILVVDGIDENSQDELDKIVAFMVQLQKQECRIQVIFTCDPVKEEVLKELELATLELTRQKIAGDMRRLAWSQVKNLPKLRRMRASLRKTIARKVSTKADSFLYIEHTMRRLNSVGSESLIIRELEHLPENTIVLYETLLKDCQAKRTPDELEILRNLFAWLTYAKSKVRVGDANTLIGIIAKENSLNIEEEIDGRLSRLLRIFGGIESEESDESSSENGIDDVADENIADIEERTSENEYNFLGFQERSLQAYFRQAMSDDGGLRCTSNEAHAIILRLISILLSSDAYEDETDKSNLHDYGAEWLMTHFTEIQIGEISDDITKNVLESLYAIFSNRSSSLKYLEVSTQGETTALGEFADEKSLAILQSWAKRALRLPANSLEHGILDWFRPLSQQPSRVFINLARAHINNWFSATIPHEAYWSFSCAHKSLEAGKDLPELQQNPLLREYFATFDPENGVSEKSFEVVSNAFWDIVKTSSSFQGIGLAMKWNDYHTASIKQFEIGLEDSTIPETQRFQITLNKGNSQLVAASGLDDEDEERNKRLPEAMETIDKAVVMYRALKDNSQITPRIEDSGYQSLIDRSLVCALLGKTEAMLENFIEAKKMRSLRVDMGQLNQIISALMKANEPIKAMDVLAMLEKIYLAYYLAYWTEDTRYLPEQSAVKSNRGQDLLDFYNDGLKVVDFTYMPENLASKLRLRAATFALQSLGKPDIAKEYLRANIQDSHTPMWDVLESGHTLSEILLEDFLQSTAPMEKKNALDEVKRLLSKLKEIHGDDFDRSESLITIVEAFMLRKLGPALEYSDTMHTLFDKCVEQLSDDTAANDLAALQRLTRVISCVPGFEYEAQVAHTCRLHNIDVPKSKANDTEKTTEKAQETDAGLEALEEPVPVVTVQETSIDIVSETPVKNDDEPSKLQNGTSEVEKPSSSEEEEEGDEDESISTIYCNNCRVSIRSWGEVAYYFCLYCHNFDLCEKCFAKNQARTNGIENQDWRVVCSERHTHIKAPVEGWKGVRDGKLLIGDAEISFENWLSDLQLKWKAYWNEFWADSGRL